MNITGPAETRPADGLAVDFAVEANRAQLREIVQRVRDGRCGQTSEPSRRSARRSASSVVPSDTRARPSSKFVREARAPINETNDRGATS